MSGATDERTPAAAGLSPTGPAAQVAAAGSRPAPPAESPATAEPAVPESPATVTTEPDGAEMLSAVAATEPAGAIPLVEEIAAPRLDPAAPASRPAASAAASDATLPRRQHAAGHPLASFGARAAAMLLDVLVLGAMDAAIVWTTSMGVLAAERLVGHPFDDALELVGVLAGVGSAALFASYFTVLHAGDGQTLGKLALHIRVTTTRGDSLGLVRSAARFAGYLVSALPLGLGFAAAMSSSRRALHDVLTGTVVARTS